MGGAGVQIPTRRASLSIGPSLGSSGLLSGIKYRLGDVQYRADLANRYESPSSVDETLALLASYREQARLIAGGTDLVLEMRRGSRPEVEVLVDISRVDGLDRIEQDVGGGHSPGAAGYPRRCRRLGDPLGSSASLGAGVTGSGGASPSGPLHGGGEPGDGLLAVCWIVAHGWGHSKWFVSP